MKAVEGWDAGAVRFIGLSRTPGRGTWREFRFAFRGQHDGSIVHMVMQPDEARALLRELQRRLRS